jgi:hypothetical protein
MEKSSLLLLSNRYRTVIDIVTNTLPILSITVKVNFRFVPSTIIDLQLDNKLIKDKSLDNWTYWFMFHMLHLKSTSTLPPPKMIEKSISILKNFFFYAPTLSLT